jgi:hypothetical protein
MTKQFADDRQAKARISTDAADYVLSRVGSWILREVNVSSAKPSVAPLRFADGRVTPVLPLRFWMISTAGNRKLVLSAYKADFIAI